MPSAVVRSKAARTLFKGLHPGQDGSRERCRGRRHSPQNAPPKILSVGQPLIRGGHKKHKLVVAHYGPDTLRLLNRECFPGRTVWRLLLHPLSYLLSVSMPKPGVKIFSPAAPAKPRLPAGLRVKGARLKIQGFRSWTSRKPQLPSRSDGVSQPRFAARRYRGVMYQEPPRTTARRVPSQPVVQALPSVGAPS